MKRTPEELEQLLRAAFLDAGFADVNVDVRPIAADDVPYPNFLIHADNDHCRLETALGGREAADGSKIHVVEWMATFNDDATFKTEDFEGTVVWVVEQFTGRRVAQDLWKLEGVAR